MYVTILTKSKLTGTISCSKLCSSENKELGTVQLECSISIPRNKSFVMPVTLKYTHS